MSDMHQEYKTVSIGGRAYEIALTLNVIDRLQDKYGSISEAFAATAKPDGFCTVLMELINDNLELHNEEHPEDLWKPLTKAYIGRNVTAHNLREINHAILAAFDASMPKTAGGNQEAEQQ